MKFIGDFDEKLTDKLHMNLEHCLSGISPFETGLEELDAFPSFKRPRVLVQKLLNTKKFETLYFAVNEACRDYSNNENTLRAFIPHITAGRVKGRFKLAGQFREIDRIKFKISKIAIVRSVLSNKGSSYSTLHVIDL